MTASVASLQKPLRFEDYERLTHKLTRKLYGWACARDRQGKPPAYEDIFQDLAVIWVQCRDGFDPSQGVQFSTYYTVAAIRHWARLELQVKRENTTISLDEPVRSQEDSVLLEEILVDPTELTPEEHLARREWASGSLGANPLLARLVEISTHPPPELKRELMALAAQRVWAQQQGLAVDQSAPSVLTPTLLGRTFGFNWRHRLAMQISEETP